MALIETVSLSQRYGERKVLSGVSLALEKGEFFALIGPSGAGKTTLLRLIDLLEAPSAGELRFRDRPYPEARGGRLALRREMAYVTQRPAVFNMSVADNIARGLVWRGAPWLKTVVMVARILAVVGLEHLAQKNARTLSGGEAQRVAIARALVTEPELLLLDEPTANLDPQATAAFEKLLREILAQYRTTILMSTHDLAQGRRLADRIGVLVAGRLTQVGRAEEIFSTPGSREVAKFVGTENIIPGRVAATSQGVVTIEIDGYQIEAVTDLPPGTPVDVCLRAEDITLARTDSPSSARNHFTGRIAAVTRQGALAVLSVDCGFPLEALITWKSAVEMSLGAASQVHVSFKATAVHVIPRETAI